MWIYYRNPIRGQRLKGMLSMSVHGGDTHEEETARRMVLRDLAAITAEDVAELRNILLGADGLMRRYSHREDIIQKLQKIMEEAAASNPLLEEFLSLQAPPPSRPPQARHRDFYDDLREYTRRATKEAHQKAAKEYSWKNYKHPWVHFERAKRKEDREAGWEWFREYESSDWEDQMADAMRSAPWEVWSESVDAKKIWDLLYDLLDPEIAYSAVRGLNNLKWPPREKVFFYGRKFRSQEDIIAIAEQIFDYPECDKIHPMFYELIQDMLASYNITNIKSRSIEFEKISELLRNNVDKLSRYSDNRPHCCYLSRLSGAAINVLEVAPVNHPLFSLILDNIAYSIMCLLSEKCPDCSEQLVDYLTIESISLPISELKTALLVAAIEEDQIDHRGIYLDKESVLRTGFLQKLLDEEDDIFPFFSREHQAFLHRANRVAKTIEGPFFEITPILDRLTSRLEKAADFRSANLHQGRDPGDPSWSTSWLPKDKDLLVIATGIAGLLRIDDSASAPILERIVRASLFSPKAGAGYNIVLALIKKAKSMGHLKVVDDIRNFYASQPRMLERIDAVLSGSSQY